MRELTLETAQGMVGAALAKAAALKLKPLAVAVFDARGTLKAFAAQEGTSASGAARSRWARRMAPSRSASVPGP